MFKRPTLLYIAVLCLLFLANCAKKGSISGGEKDVTPPEFIKALPANYSTSFDKREIRIYFDEYIKLKDYQKQIVISPPMNTKPIITPLGTASKYIRIKFQDSLIPNTTYSINFGQSIVDNNEGNPLPYFRYVFSTGKTLDSLSLQGTITDALQKKTTSFVTVALYPVDENYTDSLVYNEVPRYITNTLDSTGFKFDNLKEGTYKLVALKDKSSNYTYQPKEDMIGFYQKNISLPADTSTAFNINIFKEILDFKALKPKQISKNAFIFGYEGAADSLQIKLLSETPEDFVSKVIPVKDKDTVQYWFTPFFETDSLKFQVTNAPNYKDTLLTRFKDQYKDSLMVKSDIQGHIPFDKHFSFSANTPLTSIDKERITITDKDTTSVPFKAHLDSISNNASLTFEKAENDFYTITLLPEAVSDFIGNVNDTLTFAIRTKKYSDYGKIFLTLKEVQQYPVLVQLTDEKGIVYKEQVASDDKTIVFENLLPNKYNIRVIIDENKNEKWDTGNFLKQLQPEKVHHYPEVIDVRANWELKQIFTLQNEDE
ncbi:Ig-like domain-containing protein [Aquimarina sp. TRL1]|uniref:Ig-like domain-containing protein n=1 Tax=Aquimarina sp. (strain TRL1) TaxID=2736252 RepID=UPI00158F1243|nr:Ig-like domain-containing protein [Aquimarina sp. TRL1]QKX04543.1 Ig-like domain-containing protein [Aquimarina sp. TRL1]